ncbi:MAG: hypothetical protein P8M03_04210 [Flavobacteriaceae bacterium]|nr:hypothetical protein [Flavobacteriaceae bacterium]
MLDKKKYFELIGSRIRSELNDLKRTPESAAFELNFEVSELNKILEGKSSKKEINTLINKMGDFYPIDISDLYILEDDCSNGIKIMTGKDSIKTSRVFNRKNSNGKLLPYYEYRDSAMSKLGPFKPEWIKELRNVNNSDPHNPEIAYNNGHFLHQLTFFIGPVNFYWKEGENYYCEEMNTGDSNYITPFYPHSFSSRDNSKDAIIIAVTFGGEVRRAQKEMYWLGEERVNKYKNFGKQKNKENFNPIIISKNKIFNENKNYLIKDLAYPNHLEIAKGMEIQVLNTKSETDYFESPFHSFLFNYGNCKIIFNWKMNNVIHQHILLPGDSIYIQPFISYSFTNVEDANAKLIVYEVAGAMNSLAQIELSYFNDSSRLANETKKWF